MISESNPSLQRRSAVVIGAGQAGLSAAYALQQQGIRPLVLEKHRVAYAWDQQRWDSFCLVTPNWQCRLPDFHYNGDNPGGFMGKSSIVDYLQRFAQHVNADLREGVAVSRLTPIVNGYRLDTSEGVIEAEHVIVATGGYHIPRRHPFAERLPAAVQQLDARSYRNPESLPDGPVLVVGNGQSGSQIAEDMPISDHAEPRSVRAKTNHYLTGRDGGREIDLRQRAMEGMHLHGRLSTITREQIGFADDLAANLDQADAVYCRIRTSIDNWIEQEGIDAPIEPAYSPCWQPSPVDDPGIDLNTQPLAAVIWCTGYRSDFSWIDAPVFDGSGLPAHDRGVTKSAGLYFIGLPWLHTWGSGRFCGVSDDARYLAQVISLRLHRRDACQERLECTAILGS